MVGYVYSPSKVTTFKTMHSRGMPDLSGKSIRDHRDGKTYSENAFQESYSAAGRFLPFPSFLKGLWLPSSSFFFYFYIPTVQLPLFLSLFLFPRRLLVTRPTRDDRGRKREATSHYPVPANYRVHVSHSPSSLFPVAPTKAPSYFRLRENRRRS